MVFTATAFTGFDIRTEYPCYPIRDAVLTVSALPSNGSMGARVSFGSRLYTYNGSDWVALAAVADPSGCTFPAVAVQKSDPNRLLAVGSNVITEYCKFISSGGAVKEVTAGATVNIADGVMNLPSNYRVFLEFDTTKNKTFAFPAAGVIIGVHTADGKVELTADSYEDYITLSGTVTNAGYTSYGGGVWATATGFTVSDTVVQVDLTIMDTALTGFDIRTECPCFPIRDEILTVSALPSNGYMGGNVIYNGVLYIYNGSEWKAI